MEQQNTTTEIALIQSSAEIIKQAPDVLLKHQASRAAAEMAAGAVLSRIKASGMDEALDNAAKDLLIKLGKTVARMREDRAPITQIFDQIKKQFTEAENEIDPKKPGTTGAEIQSARDKYAAELLKKAEDDRREAEKKIAEAAAKMRAEQSIDAALESRWLSAIEFRIQKMNAAFDAITLENFEQRSAALCQSTGEPHVTEIDLVYDQTHHDRLAGRDNISTLGIDFISTLISYRVDLFRSGTKGGEFHRKYKELVLAERDRLVLKLPGLKSELEEIAEANRKANEAAAAAKAANDMAAVERAAAAKKEAERLQQEKLERENENRRLAELKAAEDRAEAERRAEMAQAAAATQALFAVDTPEPIAATPEARSTFDIEVLAPAGWAEIFQFFYMKNAATLSVEEFGKKSLNQMKKYAEDVAKKTGEMIKSKSLNYATSVKAVNRKN
jgi:murein DD-endopeptidase MepM/ murein hydrolase activator NlpD